MFPVSLRQGRPTCSDVNQSEQSHPGVSAHRPLLGLTVGLTAVVHEARLVSLRPCVDDSVLTQRQTVSLSDSREMRLFLTRLKGHRGQCLLNTFHSPHAGSGNKKLVCEELHPALVLSVNMSKEELLPHFDGCMLINKLELGRISVCLYS